MVDEAVDEWADEGIDQAVCEGADEAVGEAVDEVVLLLTLSTGSGMCSCVRGFEYMCPELTDPKPLFYDGVRECCDLLYVIRSRNPLNRITNYLGHAQGCKKPGKTFSYTKLRDARCGSHLNFDLTKLNCHMI